jgi:hypothetical protein
MRRTSILILLASILSYADSSLSARRDAALKSFNACMQHRKVASRECRAWGANVGTLIYVYKHGDKTVLPTLFRVPILTDFYGDALLADPGGFLTEMSRLHEKDQKAVAAGMAGDSPLGLLPKERFEAIRALLMGIPDSDPNKVTSQICLKAVERENARFFMSYFPPQTFRSPADFRIRRFSTDMYALGEKPLWPLDSEPETIYRLTYLPKRTGGWRLAGEARKSLTGPTLVSLSVSLNGDGRITIKTIDGDREVTKVDETVSASRDQVARFLALLDQAHFWTTSTELPSGVRESYMTQNGWKKEYVRDKGAPQIMTEGGWIMEGVKVGKYRTVVRWCSDITRGNSDEIRLEDARRLLFELAGQEHVGGSDLASDSCR